MGSSSGFGKASDRAKAEIPPTRKSAWWGSLSTEGKCPAGWALKAWISTPEPLTPSKALVEPIQKLSTNGSNPAPAPPLHARFRRCVDQAFDCGWASSGICAAKTVVMGTAQRLRMLRLADEVNVELVDVGRDEDADDKSPAVFIPGSFASCL